MNAGLAPKAPVYGGWESEEPWVAIRCHGHTLGHYLGAVVLFAPTYFFSSFATSARKSCNVSSGGSGT